MNFNLKLKKIRTFRKMTQKELSEKIGLTDQHRIVIPSPQTIVIGITINCFTIRFSDIGINMSLLFETAYLDYHIH